MFLWLNLREVPWKQMQRMSTGLGDWGYLALSLHLSRPRALAAISKLDHRFQ